MEVVEVVEVVVVVEVGFTQLLYLALLSVRRVVVVICATLKYHRPLTPQVFSCWCGLTHWL